MIMEGKKLFLLDAYALIYRAYYAMIRSPRITSKGFNTSAIFGFCNTLDEIIRKERPDYIAVCFDPEGGDTFRHEAYGQYKAQRDKQPEDITNSIPYIKEILDAYNIKVIEMPRYEADDVIGTLARKAQAEGLMTYMMTPDKDYGQLVTDSVFMYRPSLRGQGFEIRGPKEICERYGISSPSQVIDLLALEGDASDNIPGCPGVGEKTAAKLIQDWGSVENLLDHAAELKGALQKKITENAEQIRFSKFLVTIKTDVPMDVEFSEMKLREPDTSRLTDVFNRLEFRTFVKKLSSVKSPETYPDSGHADDGKSPMGSLFDIPDESDGTAGQTPAQSLETTGHRYRTANTPGEIEALISDALKKDAVGISMATSGAEAMTARWEGLALSVDDDLCGYIQMPPLQSERAEVKDIIARLFDNTSTMIISHDIKRDMIVLKGEGMDFTACYYDTSVAHYLLQPEMKHYLSNVALTYLNYRTLDYGITDTARKKTPIPPEDAATMQCEAAETTRKLFPVLKKALLETGLERLMHDIELPFISVLASMECEGVRINVHELEELSVKLTSRLDDLEQEAYRMAGMRFNISSPMQVGEVLFSHMHIDPKAKKTKRGAWSTTEEILEKYRRDHPIVDTILKIRGLKKLLTTYVDALPRLINPVTGKIHTSYNQTVTATGRISSANPNLQNIPVRSDDGREIRRAFIPDPGDLILSADYSQIELRLIADLSGDQEMIEAFLSGQDIHRATAAKIYHLPIESVTEEQRRTAKTANFGIIYGISAFGLAERLGVPRSEAKDLINGYMSTYPHIREYMDKAIENAQKQGFVTTIMGRKRFIPDINSRNAVVRGYAERNAINAPIQGSAADIIKIAMVDIARDLRNSGLKSKMIMQVHDELVFNVKPDEIDIVKEIVVRDMENAYSGKVPLTVSAGTGRNWLEAH